MTGLSVFKASLVGLFAAGGLVVLSSASAQDRNLNPAAVGRGIVPPSGSAIPPQITGVRPNGVGGLNGPRPAEAMVGRESERLFNGTTNRLGTVAPPGIVPGSRPNAAIAGRRGRAAGGMTNAAGVVNGRRLNAATDAVDPALKPRPNAAVNTFANPDIIAQANRQRELNAAGTIVAPGGAFGASLNRLGFEVGQDTSGGVGVTSVNSGGLAAQAGLTPNDVITGVNGQQINSPTDLADMLAGVQPGGTLFVDVTSSGATRRLSIPVQSQSDVGLIANGGATNGSLIWHQQQSRMQAPATSSTEVQSLRAEVQALRAEMESLRNR